MAGRHPIRRRRRGVAGFTLVELLIAGLMSAMVLIAVYFVFISNTTQYYRQEQVVQMQEGMRFALEYLKNDLRNAGRLAIAKGNGPGRDPQLCAERLNVRGLELFENERGTPQVLTRNNNLLFPDRVRLMVDATGAAMVRVRRVTPGQVILAAADQQPTAAGRALLSSEARFQAAFRAGHLLSISSPGKAMDMVPIAEVAFDPAGSTITLALDLCADNRIRTCDQSCMVAGIQLVEYAIRSNDDEPERTDLVRRVIDARNGETALADSELTVADYAVDLQLWCTYDTRAPGAPLPLLPPDPDPTDDLGNGPMPREAMAIAQRTHRVRSIYVMLATRTPREDEDLKVTPGRGLPVGDRIAADRTWFDLDNRPGSGFARVATQIAEVEAANLYRGL